MSGLTFFSEEPEEFEEDPDAWELEQSFPWPHHTDELDRCRRRVAFKGCVCPNLLPGSKTRTCRCCGGVLG